MGFFSILWWIISGFFIGLIARAIMPGEQKMGWILTAVLGIAGSFTGGSLGRLLFGGATDQVITPSGTIGSLIGALILLLIYGFVMKSRGGKTV